MRPAGFNPSATPDANKFIVGVENFRTLLSTQYRKVTTRTRVHGTILLVGVPAFYYWVMNQTTPGGSQILRDQSKPLQSKLHTSAHLTPKTEISAVSTPIVINPIDAFGPKTPLSDNPNLAPYGELVIASREYNKNPDRVRNWIPDPTHYLVRDLPAAPPAAYSDIAARASAAISAYAMVRGHNTTDSKGYTKE